MTQEEIIEGNKLIAFFMGAYRPLITFNEYESIFLYKNGVRWLQVESLQYNSSYDWLMPVVEKIESLGYFCMINKWTSVYTGSKEGERIEITSILGNTKILNTWKAIIEFIKYYNNENNQNN